MPPSIQLVISYLNSGAFIGLLEEITGINQLLPDPYLYGAGMHQSVKGGFLGIHADFSEMKHLRIYRRLNLIVYLNGEWQESWGGNLEFRSEQAEEIIKVIIPEFNRLVLFETTDSSYHGFPKPINGADDIKRNSIALYYYTIENSEVIRGYDTRWRQIGKEKLTLKEEIRKNSSRIIRRLSRKLENFSRKIDIY